MLVPIMAVAIVNGIFSPFVLVVFVFYPVWFPSWAPAYSQVVYMLSALILSTLTIMLAGVTLLSLPALPNVLRALGLAA